MHSLACADVWALLSYLYFWSVRFKALEPLTASLWSSGVKFGGVIIFLFIVLFTGGFDIRKQSPVSTKSATCTKENNAEEGTIRASLHLWLEGGGGKKWCFYYPPTIPLTKHSSQRGMYTCKCCDALPCQSGKNYAPSMNGDAPPLPCNLAAQQCRIYRVKIGR